MFLINICSVFEKKSLVNICEINESVQSGFRLIMNNSNAGGVFDIELQDAESSGVSPLEQSDDDSEFLDEVGGTYFFIHSNLCKTNQSCYIDL